MLYFYDSKQKLHLYCFHMTGTLQSQLINLLLLHERGRQNVLQRLQMENYKLVSTESPLQSDRCKARSHEAHRISCRSRHACLCMTKQPQTINRTVEPLLGKAASVECHRPRGGDSSQAAWQRAYSQTAGRSAPQRWTLTPRPSGPLGWRWGLETQKGSWAQLERPASHSSSSQSP